MFMQVTGVAAGESFWKNVMASQYSTVIERIAGLLTITEYLKLTPSQAIVVRSRFPSSDR